MREHVNQDFNPPYTWENVPIILLQDIRAELRRIRAVLECHNTQAIPRRLASIDRKLTRKKPLRSKSGKSAS